jgi:hypothetical protein
VKTEHPEQTNHNLPKTTPPQDLLITNALTQGQIPWVDPIYESTVRPHRGFVSGTGLPVHLTQSGGQPSHLPLLPHIDVKRSTRRQNP